VINSVPCTLVVALVSSEKILQIYYVIYTDLMVSKITDQTSLEALLPKHTGSYLCCWQQWQRSCCWG